MAERVRERRIYFMTMKIIIFALGYFTFYIMLVLSLFITKLAKRKQVVLINFEELVDLSEIRTRAKIYCANRDGVTEAEYIGAHISEQKVVPKMIRKVQKFVREKYNIIYYSAIRDESLRIFTASILNDWGLTGSLYLKSDWQQPTQFKEWLIQKNIEQGNIINQVIDSDPFMRSYCRINGIRVF